MSDQQVKDDRWHLVGTEPKRERWAAHKLRSIGVTAYVPMCVVKMRRRGKIIEALQPLYCGFVFMRRPADQHPRRWVDGVNGEVKVRHSSGDPVPLRPGTVELIQRAEAEQEDGILRFGRHASPLLAAKPRTRLAALSAMVER